MPTKIVRTPPPSLVSIKELLIVGQWYWLWVVWIQTSYNLSQKYDMSRHYISTPGHF